MYAKSMRVILSALIALAVIAGIVAPASEAMAARRDQWVPQFKSDNPSKTSKAPRAVKNVDNDDDDNDSDVAAGPDDDDDDPNEEPEWVDEAF